MYQRSKSFALPNATKGSNIMYYFSFDNLDKDWKNVNTFQNDEENLARLICMVNGKARIKGCSKRPKIQSLNFI